MTPERIAVIREHQRLFKAECDESETNDQRGRYAIPHAWKMWHDIDELIAQIEQERSER